MVDEEIVADLRSGMDVYARVAVGILGHHPGQDGDLQMIQLMGHPVHQNGKQAGVGEQDLLPGSGSGVAVKGGLQIHLHLLRDLGQLCYHFRGQIRGTILLTLRQSQSDLTEKLLLNALQKQCGVVLRGQAHESRFPVIGRENETADVLNEQDYRLPVGQPQLLAIERHRACGIGLCHGLGCGANMVFSHHSSLLK